MGRIYENGPIGFSPTTPKVNVVGLNNTRKKNYFFTMLLMLIIINIITVIVVNVRRYYSYFIISSKFTFKILNFIYHTIPACLMDVLAFAIGKKMIYRRAYAKTERILIMMSFFGLREWNFGNENIKMLVEKTQKFHTQKYHLEFDMRKINWNEYFHNYIPGISKYYFKESTTNAKRSASTYEWYEYNYCY
jgi:fatty acyl-CoA reductase